jgi:hypothetical protein
MKGPTGWSKSICAPDGYNTESQVHRDFLTTLYIVRSQKFQEHSDNKL